MPLFQDMRAVALEAARGAGRAAFARAPEGLQSAVSRVRERYEAGRVDAQKALEELGSIEEQALRVATQLLAFPFFTVGAIKDLYARQRDLERGVQERDERIRALEQRLRDLERRV